MKRAVSVLISLIILLMVAGCSRSSNEAGISCSSSDQCGPGQVCDTFTGQCLEHVKAAPGLEVWPPAQNNQGWVVQEFPEPLLAPDGHLIVRLNTGVSIEGRVYASHDRDQLVHARIIAWRDSLLEGRPRVQVETATDTKRDGPKDSFLLWLNQGHRYNVYVSPLPPYDTEYPPLVVTDLEVGDHMRHDFVLDGDDRAVQVRGRILDANGNALNAQNSIVTDASGKVLDSSMRVRAFEMGGLKQSTTATSDPETGEFSFKVPSGVASYSIKVETSQGSIPIPTLECTKMVLGIASPSEVPDTPPTQTIGDIRLPSFAYPKLYTATVQGNDGSPVEGASVTFALEIDQPKNEGFDQCKVRFERSGITDASGKVELLLLPGSSMGNKIYSVTVQSPSKSRFASRLLNRFEVGPNAGFLASIMLTPRYHLSGQVVNKADGQPVAGVVIEAQGIVPTGTNLTLPVSDASATTEQQGIFDLYVDPGIYNLNLNPPQDSGLPNFGMIAKVEGDLEGKIFEIPQAKILPGKVIDPTGKSLSFAKVNVYELMPQPDNPSNQKATLRASSITDENGTFNLILPELP